MQHVSDVIVQLHEVFPSPSLELVTFGQNSVTRTRQNGRHTRKRTKMLQRRPLLESALLRHLSFVGCACLFFIRRRVSCELVGGHAVHPATQIGHEQ
jgi:hypothetical protein